MPRWDFLIRIASIGYVNRGQTEARMRRSRVLRLRHLALRAGTAWSEASVLRRCGLVVRRFTLRVGVAIGDRQRPLRSVICPTRELQRWRWRRRSGQWTARLIYTTTRESACIHRHCAARIALSCSFLTCPLFVPRDSYMDGEARKAKQKRDKTESPLSSPQAVVTCTHTNTHTHSDRDWKLAEGTCITRPN